MFHWVISTEPFHLLYNHEFAVVIYSTKIMLAISCKDVNSYIFPQLPLVFHAMHFIYWSCCLEIKACRAVLVVSLMLAFMYMDSCASKQIWFMSMWLRCSCSSDLSCGATGIIIVLPFIAIPSMIAISSMNDQYFCSSFCTFSFCQWPAMNAHSDSMPRCTSPSFAPLIFSAVMEYGRSMYDSIAFMMIHMPHISLSLSVSWLCLD